MVSPGSTLSLLFAALLQLSALDPIEPLPAAPKPEPPAAPADVAEVPARAEKSTSGLAWRVMRGHPHIVRGLKRAGFTGGWLEAR